MISTSDRKKAIELINDTIQAGARLKPSCSELGISTRTYQRWSQSPESLEDKRPIVARKPPKNRLSLKKELRLLKL